MKKFQRLNLFISTIMILVFISGQSAFAKGSVSTSSSSSRSSSSTVSKTSGSGFKTGSFSSSSTTSKSSSTSKSTPISSPSSTVSKGTTSKSSSISSSSSKQSVNTNSKALNNIPSSYSSHSVSNKYYYNVDNGGSSFWSNYWMYRALTPEHRTYIVSDGSSTIAPSYTGVSSIIPDLITLVIIISIVGITIYIIKKRRERR